MDARFAALARLDVAALKARMHEARGGDGLAPDDGGALHASRLSGYLWHGLALATPGPLMALVGKFGKTFITDPASGAVRGWNVRMRQSRDARWDARLVRGHEIVYGRYEVTAAPVAGPYPDALLIDYGRGANRAWDPLRLVRDFIVPIEPDLWLGHMWLAVGSKLVPTPSWFALARGESIG